MIMIILPKSLSVTSMREAEYLGLLMCLRRNRVIGSKEISSRFDKAMDKPSRRSNSSIKLTMTMTLFYIYPLNLKRINNN